MKSVATGSFLVPLAVGYAIFWTWIAMAPVNRFGWFLDNILIFVCVALLAVSYRMLRLSIGSYVCIAMFLLLHTYGAHVSYGATPFDELLQSVFGGGIRTTGSFICPTA